MSDARGNVISSLDSNGSISGYNTYTPFGYQKNIDPNQKTFNPLNISQLDQGYNGMVTDRVTGDQFLGNGYRVYNPVLGRFMKLDSESPYGDGGINGYAYVNNDPINATDPTGHMSQVATSFLTAGVGIVSFLAIGASLGALTPEAIAMDATFSTLYGAGSGAVAGGGSALAAAATEDGINGDNFADSMKNGQWTGVIAGAIGGSVLGEGVSKTGILVENAKITQSMIDKFDERPTFIVAEKFNRDQHKSLTINHIQRNEYGDYFIKDRRNLEDPGTAAQSIYSDNNGTFDARMGKNNMSVVNELHTTIRGLTDNEVIQFETARSRQWASVKAEVVRLIKTGEEPCSEAYEGAVIRQVKRAVKFQEPEFKKSFLSGKESARVKNLFLRQDAQW